MSFCAQMNSVLFGSNLICDQCATISGSIGTVVLDFVLFVFGGNLHSPLSGTISGAPGLHIFGLPWVATFHCLDSHPSITNLDHGCVPSVLGQELVKPYQRP